MIRMLIAKGFLKGLQYRANLLIEAGGIALFFLLRVFLWMALLEVPAGDLHNPELRRMVTYLLISTIPSVFPLGMAGHNLGKRILSGDIAMDLIKPYHPRTYLLSEALGHSLFQFLVLYLPCIVIVCIVIPPVAPASLAVGLLFAVMVLLSLAVVFLLYYLMGLACFWMKTDFYIDWMMGALMTIFGGGLVPLWMYPEALLTISKYLPFRYMTYEAAAVYLGTSGDPWLSLLVQLIWVVGLALLSDIVWRRAQRRIFVLGG